MKAAKTLAGLAFTGLLVAGAASATPTLYLNDGLGDTLLYVAGGAVITTGAVSAVTCTTHPNGVTCDAIIGTWDVNVTTGVSSSPKPKIDLNSIDESTAAGTMDIQFGDTGFKISGPTLTLSNRMGGTSDGSMVWASCVNTNNSQIVPNNCLQSSTVFGPKGPGAFSETDPFNFNGISGAFALALGVLITHTDAGLTSFDYNGSAPEPATLALLGIGLLGAAVIRRRKLS